MTRQTLQDDLLRLWQETGVSVLFVTHNIDEAIFLAQRVVVMAPHPGTIVSDQKIDAVYPRDRGSKAFGELYSTISTQLIGSGRRAA
jgi:NitT/TauT family transport system ATP-binding protein